MTSAPGDMAASDDILAKLKQASSAEDFFALLNVDYDAEVMNVARLHILKRMSQYLAMEEFSELSNDVIAAHCKAALQCAYDDFVASSPLQERVFKVLKNAMAERSTADFVSYDTLFE